MADEVKGNTAVGEFDHDRVAMLSLNADGTPNQTPGVELIGNREFAESATREQFMQQAVSAADQRERGITTADAGTTVEDAPQDPEIERLADVHKGAAEAALKAADSTVEQLFTSDPALTSDPDASKTTTPVTSTGAGGSTTVGKASSGSK